VQLSLQWKSNKYYILWVGVCSLRYSACKAHAPYFHLWPMRLYNSFPHYLMGRVAQSVQRLATGWTVRGSNPGEGAIFRTCPDRPWGPPSLLYNEYRVFPGVKSGRGVTLTPHPLLVPWSRKGRAIPLLPLWAVRPVQSLSACTRVQFTFLTYIWKIILGKHKGFAYK